MKDVKNEISSLIYQLKINLDRFKTEESIRKYSRREHDRSAAQSRIEAIRLETYNILSGTNVNYWMDKEESSRDGYLTMILNEIHSGMYYVENIEKAIRHAEEVSGNF